MKHNELLDKIYWHWKNADDSEFHGLSGYRKALRAVVELHKPIEPDIYLEEDEKYLICSVCMEFDEDVKYPCPTIKAIEEELK